MREISVSERTDGKLELKLRVALTCEQEGECDASQARTDVEKSDLLTAVDEETQADLAEPMVVDETSANAVVLGAAALSATVLARAL